MDIEFVSNHNDWEALIIDGEVVDEGHSIDWWDILPTILELRDLDKSTPTFKATSFEDEDPYEIPAKITEYIESAPYRHKVKRLAKSRSAQQQNVMYRASQGDNTGWDEINPPTFRGMVESGLVSEDKKITELGLDVVKFVNWKPETTDA